MFLQFFIFFLVSSPLLFSADGKEIHVKARGSDNQACGCATLPCATIQFAVSLAEAGDVVVLHGSFHLKSTISINKNIQLSGGQNTLAPATLNCGKKDLTAVSISKGVSTSLSNLVIENCEPHSSSALRSFSASVVLENMNFRNNKRWRGDGGAISVFGGKMQIRNSNFERNSAVQANGGAISCTNGCELKLEDTVLAENEAQNIGGGLYLTQSSSVAMERVVIGGNMAKSGAGIASLQEGFISGQDVIFEENSATSSCAQIQFTDSDRGGMLVRTTFVSANATLQAEDDSTGEDLTDICIKNVIMMRFKEVSLQGNVIGCSSSRFQLEDSTFSEGEESNQAAVRCDQCFGISGDEKLCS